MQHLQEYSLPLAGFSWWRARHLAHKLEPPAGGKVNRTLDCPGQQWKPRSPQLVCSLKANLRSAHIHQAVGLVFLGKLSPHQVLGRVGSNHDYTYRGDLYCSAETLTEDSWGISVLLQMGKSEPRTARPFTGSSSGLVDPGLGLWITGFQIEMGLQEQPNPSRGFFSSPFSRQWQLVTNHWSWKSTFFSTSVGPHTVVCNTCLHWLGCRYLGWNRRPFAVCKWHTADFIGEALEADTFNSCWASCSSESSTVRPISTVSQPVSCKRLWLRCLGPLRESLRRKRTSIHACVYMGDSPWIQP